MADRRDQGLETPVALPWRVVTLNDGSVNVFGGPDGSHFVCTCGHGEGAREDAHRIIVAVEAAEMKESTHE